MTFSPEIAGDPAALVATFVATIILFTALWAIHVKIEDASIVDFVWGPGFVVIGAVAAVSAGGGGLAAFGLLAAATLWAARLTLHLVARHRRTGEDPRYRAMREAGGRRYALRALVTVFWLQALIQWLLALPLVAAFRWPAGEVATGLYAVGLAMFAMGLAIETAADRQLARWRADPASAGQLLTGGLFAWSRHPNYFGEALLWWGIGLGALAVTGSPWPLAAPLLLTLLLLRVSGLPLVEARMGRHGSAFEDWRRRTSPFVPMPPTLYAALTRRLGRKL